MGENRDAKRGQPELRTFPAASQRARSSGWHVVTSQTRRAATGGCRQGYRAGLTSPSCHRRLVGVIRSFRHRALKRLWEGDPSRVGAALRSRIGNVLAVLDAAATPADLDLPGYRLHALKGEWRGLWSVTISGNWRITFRIDGGDAFDVDLTDYH